MQALSSQAKRSGGSAHLKPREPERGEIQVPEVSSRNKPFTRSTE
jgi:hypothetical protein